MRETWKRLWACRPRLSRGQKTARNFLLCIPTLVLFWGIWGYPLPTAEMEFRRMEHTNLLPRSEIVFRDDGKEQDLVQENEDLFLTLRQPTFIGVAGGNVTAAVFSMHQWLVGRYPLEEGPTPVPFVYAHAVWYKPGFVAFRYPLMFIQVPREAAQGKLSLGLTYRETDYSWSGQGYDLGDGVWMFPVNTPDTGYSDNWCQGASYTLTLYRADGSLLTEQSGLIPE